MLILPHLAGQTAPALSENDRDLVYANPEGHPQLLDLYVPAGSGPFPVVVYIHGGGWQGGTKDENPLKMVLGETNYVLVSINYRYSQDAVFPAQIQDSKAAIRWLRANAAKYRIDPAKIGVWGSSAGGHLVALLGTTSGDKRFDVGDYLSFSSDVQAVCDFYGPTDFTHGLQDDAHKYPVELVDKLLGGSATVLVDKAREASPLTYVAGTNPPFIIFHGTEDPVVPVGQSQVFYDALIKANVPAELNLVPGAQHGGPAFFKPDVVRKVSDFFAKYLLSKQSTVSIDTAKHLPAN